MSNIKNLPIEDRPREKALRYGVSTLSDYELLALLLNKGYRGVNIIEISTTLLNKYGGIVGLFNIPISELKKNKGIKDVGALKIGLIKELMNRIGEKNNSLSTKINDELYLYNKYRYKLSSSNQEHLILIVLNRNKRIIYEKELYKGSSDCFAYKFEDIYKELIKCDGKNFYLIHNHPGGDSSPSEEDIKSTYEIIFESKRRKLRLIDHIIIGDDSYYSFKKMKKISISC